MRCSSACLPPHQSCRCPLCKPRFTRTSRESLQRQRDLVRHLCQPLSLLGKSLPATAYSWRRRKTPYPLRLCLGHIDDLLDPAIKLLEAQDKWRIVLDSYYHTTNRNRHWSLLRKLGRIRSRPPPNISNTFEGKPHSSSKAIAEPFNGQFTTCSVQPDRTRRRLMKDVQGLSHRTISLLCCKDIGAAPPSRPSWRRWIHASHSTVSNRGTPPPRPCSPFLLGWSLASISLSPLAEHLL